MTNRAAALVIVATLAALPGGLAQDTGRDRLLHYSLQIDIDDEARTQLAASQTELSRGDVLTAVSRWRALLDTAPPGSLIPVGDTFLSIPTAVRSILKSQPREIRQEYLRITEPLAARTLQQAISRDDREAFRSLIERFPLTAAADEACTLLAEQSFDAGDFQTCQTTVDRWLDDADNVLDSVKRHPEMVAWRTLALHSLGDPVEAQRIWSRFSSLVPRPLQQMVHIALMPGSGAAPSPPAEIGSIEELLPSEDRIWSRELSDLPPAAEWNSLKNDFEELAHPLLMVGSPEATTQGIIVSALGRQQLDFTGTEKSLVKTTNSTAAGSRTDSVDSLRAALGESLVSRSTIAGDVLYTVEPVSRRTSPVPFSSSLIARSLSTGQAIWSLSEFPQPSGQPASAAMILAPPLERFGNLVFPIQSGDEIDLLSIDAGTTKLRWRVRLGDVGLSLMADTRRRWMPAVMATTGDAVMCATGNGAVASVELATGRLQWIFRSQREDWRDAGPPPMSAVINSPRFRMWTGWREPVLRVFGDSVIWAGPETNALTAIDRHTGAVRWSQPRGDRLAVVADDATLLTIAADEVQRLNPVDGTFVWTKSVTTPAGLGFHAAGWYVLPLRMGGSIAFKLSSGEAVRSVAWEAEVLRNSPSPLEQLRSLTWTPAGIIVQSPRSVSLYRTVAERGKSSGPAKSPKQLAASGRLSDAIEAVENDPDALVLKARLASIANETARDQYHITLAPQERSSTTPVESRVSQRLEAFLVDRRPETALSLLETCSLAELAANWVESNSRPRSRIRADRLVAATLIDTTVDQIDGRVVHALAPAMQQRLDKLLSTLRSDRPHEIPELFSLFQSTDWGAGHLLLHLEHPELPAVTARQKATRRLALMQLATLGGSVGSRARQLLATLTPHKHSLTDWPSGEIHIEKPRAWSSFLDHRPVTVDVGSESELAGLTVEFRLNAINDRKSGLLQFSGCGESRPWSIDLPKTNRNLATSADYRNATVIGPLVLTQIGSGLFGFLAFDDNGERGISSLWEIPSIDVWGRVATHSVNFLPRLSDVAPGRHPIDLDDFGRPLTQVGPVTAAWFCYREFDRLVACETATGRRLWDRRPYEPDAFATGSDAYVILVSPRAGRIEILDPLDGNRLAIRDFQRPPADWQATFDNIAILRSGRADGVSEKSNEASELKALDLLTDKVRWRQAIPKEAIAFNIGQRLAGAVDASSIRLFDAKTGEQQLNLAVNPPGDFAEVYAIDDPFALMIGVFSPPAVEQLRPPMMLIGSRRRPYANGIVYGLDPQTLELKWTLPLDKSVFPLDQPRDIPLLVLNDARLNVDSPTHEIAEDRIRVFDKRTGRQVGSDLMVSGQAFTIERSQAGGWVQIRSKNKIDRYEFSPAP